MDKLFYSLKVEGIVKTPLDECRDVKEFDEETWMEVRILMKITIKSLREMADAMEAFIE